MDPKIRQALKNILDSDDDANWLIFADMLEEAGPAEDLAWRWEEVFVEAGSWLDVLRALRRADQGFAQMLIEKFFPLKDYPRQELPADKVNIPTCGENWYQDLRREQASWVVGEVGNLEEEPWTVVPLTTEDPMNPYVTDYATITVPNPESGERPLRATVTVRPDAAYIGTVDLPNGHSFDLERARVVGARYGSPIPTLPEWADEEEILQRGREMVEATNVSSVWRSQDMGEGVRLSGGAYREHLWLDSAPEGFRPRRSHRGETFRTVYSDGGGFQDAPPEYLLDLETLDLWAKMSEGAHRAEVDCPYTDTEDGDTVTLQHTRCGESPGEQCAMCEEDVGQPHGILSIGEGSETVYVRVPDEAEDDED